LKILKRSSISWILKTARAAYDVIAGSPSGSGHHYFVADAHDAFGLESSGTRRKPIPVDKQYCHANHCLDAGIAARSKVPPTSTTFDRQKLLEADLARAQVHDLDDAWKRLGSTDGWPRSICTNMATPEAPHGVATCGAIAMNLITGELYVQQGFINNVKPERYQL
jgi:isopenicillin-N N-acyltransferase-like protein